MPVAATATIPSSTFPAPIVAPSSGPIVPFGALRRTYTVTASFELAVTGPARAAIDDVTVGTGSAALAPLCTYRADSTALSALSPSPPSNSIVT